MGKCVNTSLKGFTLAEVLVTLLVIGVIAALTIPNLIANIQDHQYKTAWKKVYSDINQATGKIIMDNGGSLQGVFTSPDVMKNKYKNYLLYINDCDWADHAGNCWHDTWQALDRGWTDTAFHWDSIGAIGWSSFPGLTLGNGSLLIFLNYSPNCNNNAAEACGTIYADINGFNKPNMQGKDIFLMYVLKDKILPYGTTWQYDFERTNGASCSTTKRGYGCSALYLMQ